MVGTSGLDKVPHEILFFLLEKLPPADILSISQTCTTLYHVAHDNLLWKLKWIQQWGLDTREIWNLANCVHHLKQTTSLFLTSSDSFDPQNLNNNSNINPLSILTNNNYSTNNINNLTSDNINNNTNNNNKIDANININNNNINNTNNNNLNIVNNDNSSSNNNAADNTRTTSLESRILSADKLFKLSAPVPEEELGASASKKLKGSQSASIFYRKYPFWDPACLKGPSFQDQTPELDLTQVDFFALFKLRMMVANSLPAVLQFFTTSESKIIWDTTKIHARTFGGLLIADLRGILQRWANEPLSTLAVRYQADLLIRTLEKKTYLNTFSPNCDLEQFATSLATWYEKRPASLEIKSFLDEVAKSIEVGTKDSRFEIIKKITTRLFHPMQLNITGNERNYYDSENSILTRVIQNKKGIPITLALLFILVSKRLNIQVYGINYPGHFLLAVLKNASCTRISEEHISNDDFIFIDPWRKLPQETQIFMEVSQLGENFSRLNVQSQLLDFSRQLGVNEFCLRMCRNLVGVFDQYEHDQAKLSQVLSFMTKIEPNNIEYWAERLKYFFQDSDMNPWETQDFLLKCRKKGFGFSEKIFGVLDEIIKAEKMGMKRSKEDLLKAKYRPGQLMVHARYGYYGLIYGFDAKCEGTNFWMNQMGVHQLQRGANQPFYNVLVDVRFRPGNQTTYVAEDNITLTTFGTRGPVQHPMVGKYFQRFNTEKNTYELTPFWQQFWDENE